MLRPTTSRARPQTWRQMLGMIRPAGKERSSPMSPPTATCATRCASFPATASCPASRSRTCVPASASRWRRASTIRSISCSGSTPRRRTDEAKWEFALGTGRPGWHIECSAMSSRAARRALRHPRRRPGFAVSPPRERDRPVRRRARPPSSITGCTTASCAWTTRRCPSRWAISSPSARCSRSTTPRWCASSSCVPTIAAR